MAAKKKNKKEGIDRDINTMAVTAQEINPETVADLRPSGYNPRVITADQQKMLDKSLKEFGDIGVIIFNRQTGRLIGGHQRTKLLDPKWPIVKEPHTDGLGTVAIGYVDTPHGRLTYREVDWPEQREKMANIAANKHGGTFDEDLLGQLLREQYEHGADMELSGFAGDELNDLLGLEKEKTLGKEDPKVEPVPDPFVQMGDLWICGDSRILCGDSTSIADIDKLLMGEKVDCVVTDPPYNVAYESKAGKIENDNMSDKSFFKFMTAIYSSIHYALKPGGAFYVYHADGGDVGETFRRALKATKGLMCKQTLIWAKSHATLCRSDYNMAHEPCLYGWKEGAAHYYDGDFTRTSVIDNEPDIKKMSRPELEEYIKVIKEREIPSTIIRIDNPTNNPIHPTMKPVRLFERNIYGSSRPGEVVLDLFNGSGTTTITCRKTGRRGRGMEFSPQYLQASLQRYWDYCGEEPMLMDADGKLTPFSEVEKQRANR